MTRVTDVTLRCVQCRGTISTTGRFNYTNQGRCGCGGTWEVEHMATETLPLLDLFSGLEQAAWKRSWKQLKAVRAEIALVTGVTLTGKLKAGDQP